MKAVKLENINKKYYWLIAAGLSALSIFLMFLYQGMVGGDYILMRSDLLVGNFASIKDFARSVIEGENVFFSFNKGLGLDNIFDVANNCLSPFNILYIILFKVDDNVVTCIVIILKIAAAAASFQFFSKKLLKNDAFSSVIVSVFYALCAFNVAYGTIMIMWLDAIIILPMLCIAIAECIDNNKRVFLIVLYVYLFVSQFYMAYMVGIFSLLFVVCYLLFMHSYNGENVKDKAKEFFSKLFNWFLGGVVAALLSAVIWVPTLFFIMGNRVEDSTAILDISASLLSIINSLFWGTGYGINGDYAYIYCGSAVLLFAPLFFISKEIKNREKAFWGVLLSFFMLCTIITPLNSFMHVFDQPDNFWYRYSFLISFVLCAIVARLLSVESGEITVKHKVILGAIIVFYLLEQQLVPIWMPEAAMMPQMNTSLAFVINIALVISWFTLFAVSFQKTEKRKLCAVLACVLAVAETSTSSLFVLPNKYTTEEFYEVKDYVGSSVEEIEANDKGLFRTICSNNPYYNVDTWYGCNGISDFGDEEKYSVRKFLSNIGFATSTRWTNESGYTPVSNMLLGVKYNIVLPNHKLEDEDFDELENDEENKKYIVNDEALSFAYMVNGDVVLYEYPGRNVFENMNTIVSTMTGADDECFAKVPEDKIKFDERGIVCISNSQNNTYKIKQTDENGELFLTVFDDNYDGEVYFQAETDFEKTGWYMYDFRVAGTENSGLPHFETLLISNADKMHYNKKKEKYNLVICGEEGLNIGEANLNGMNFYYLNRDAFEKQHEILAAEQLNVSEWKQGYVKGTVNVTDDKTLMFTSIPYDPGWHTYVDGMETKPVRLIDGAFLGTFIPGGGEHTVEFKYEVPGMKIGLIVSLCGILAFLAVVFEKKIKSFDTKKSDSASKEVEKQKENC